MSTKAAHSAPTVRCFTYVILFSLTTRVIIVADEILRGDDCEESLYYY